MARNVFSVPIFFIVFRETLEAAIIISVLLGLVEQIVHDDPGALVPGALPPAAAAAPGTPGDEKERPPLEKAGSSENGDALSAQPQLTSGAGEEPQPDTKRLLRKMRLYIFAGAFLGLFLALAIGAAFIAVWFTQASDLWAKSEELWEGQSVRSLERARGCCAHRCCGTGIFELIASLIIFVMGVSMLKMDRAKAKWRVKLSRAFSGKGAFAARPFTAYTDN